MSVLDETHGPSKRRCVRLVPLGKPNGKGNPWDHPPGVRYVAKPWTDDGLDEDITTPGHALSSSSGGAFRPSSVIFPFSSFPSPFSHQCVSPPPPSPPHPNIELTITFHPPFVGIQAVQARINDLTRHSWTVGLPTQMAQDLTILNMPEELLNTWLNRIGGMNTMLALHKRDMLAQMMDGAAAEKSGRFLFLRNASQYEKEAGREACVPISCATAAAFLCRESPPASTLAMLRALAESCAKLGTWETTKHSLDCVASQRLFSMMAQDMDWERIRALGISLMNNWKDRQTAAGLDPRLLPHADAIINGCSEFKRFCEVTGIRVAAELSGVMAPADVPTTSDEDSGSVSLREAVALMTEGIKDAALAEAAAFSHQETKHTEFAAVLTFRNVTLTLMFACEHRKNPGQVTLYVHDSHGKPETRQKSHIVRLTEPTDLERLLFDMWPVASEEVDMGLFEEAPETVGPQQNIYSMLLLTRAVYLDPAVAWLLQSDL